VTVLVDCYEQNNTSMQTIIISSLLTGFCGCLTTVSSYIQQASKLSLKYSWAYAFGSIFVAQSFILIAYGSYFLR